MSVLVTLFMVKNTASADIIEKLLKNNYLFNLCFKMKLIGVQYLDKATFIG